MKKIIDFYIFSSLHISICTMAMVIGILSLQNSVWPHINYIVFVGASTLFLYNLHRWIGIKKLKSTIGIERFEWSEKHINTIIAFLFLGAGISLYSFFTIHQSAQIWILVASFLTFLYVLPILPQSKRLRDIGLVKIFIVAASWAIVTGIVPLLLMNQSTQDISFVFFEKFSFILALTVPFDIRDIIVDKKLGVNTLAVRFKKYSLPLMLLFFAAAILFTFLSSWYSNIEQYALSLIYIIVSIITIWASKKDSDYYISGVIDGMMLLYGILLLLFL